MSRILSLILIITGLVGCGTMFESSPDEFLHHTENGYVLLEKDEDKLEGPYKIIDRITANKMIVLKGGKENELLLRGCRGLGGEYDNIVKHSFPEDLGVYLLKNTMVESASNRITAIAYTPARQVYIGMPKGFRNLSYIMPQLVHMVNGALLVDHSDTNYPQYRVFADAEIIAKRNKKGYWATHTESPVQTVPFSSGSGHGK